jgi:hypothetical protein
MLLTGCLFQHALPLAEWPRDPSASSASRQHVKAKGLDVGRVWVPMTIMTEQDVDCSFTLSADNAQERWGWMEPVRPSPRQSPRVVTTVMMWALDDAGS